MKSIYFGCGIDDTNLTGRELLSSMHRKALAEIDAENTAIYLVKKTRQRGSRSILLGVRGWLDGLRKEIAADVRRKAREFSAETLFIDGSNYGRLARELRREFPDLFIVTFFHNVESVFFWHAFRSKPAPRALAVLVCNYLSERMAVKHSDLAVCLNSRDKEALSKIYGCKRTAILPLCIKEAPNSEDCSKRKPATPLFGLFVGGAFYANVRGVLWFATEVSGFLDCPIYVVGKGFEKYKGQIERHKNMFVVGEVTDVGDWYALSAFVVCPIFEGSGMKTKTAEALQYGRPIFGTRECFVGYEEHIANAGKLCISADQFAYEINRYLAGEAEYKPDRARDIYKRFYSEKACRANLRAIMERTLLE